jgi:TonB family protein
LGGPEKFVYCIKETFRQAHLIFVANPENVMGHLMAKLGIILLFILTHTLLSQTTVTRDAALKKADRYAKWCAEENAKRKVMGLPPVACDSAFVTSDGQSTFMITDKQSPTYPGGYPKLREFISKNLKKPLDAVPGKVTVRFTVLENGQVTNPIVLKGLKPSCDKAAIEVIKKLKFNPALDENNKPTTFLLNLPVDFE